MNNRNKPSWISPERIKREIGAWTAIGATAIVGVWGYMKLTDQSGEYKLHSPNLEKKFKIDNQHKVVTWNMHSETFDKVKDIRELLEDGRLDVLALQEVDEKDISLLRKEFPHYYITHAIADDNAKLNVRGFGNAIVTRQKPSDIEVLSIDGTTGLETIARTARGALDDAAQARPSLQKTKDGRQEKRAALALTVKVRTGNSNQLKEVNHITSHTSGHNIVKGQQSEELFDFVKKSLRDDQPTIFMGDLNAEPREIIPRFAELGMITSETPRTNPKGQVLDYISYHEAGILGLGNIAVRHSYLTDHHPVEGEWIVEE